MRRDTRAGSIKPKPKVGIASNDAWIVRKTKDFAIKTALFRIIFIRKVKYFCIGIISREFFLWILHLTLKSLEYVIILYQM